METLPPLTALQSRSLALVAGLGLGCLVLLGSQVTRSPSPYPLGDFFALWSSARVLATAPVGTVYDMQALHALQLGMGLDGAGPNPYPYPPQAALVLLPLAALGYWAAAALWLAGGLAAYAAAVGWRAGQGGAADGRAMAALALLAPTTAINVGFGQSGFVVGALLVGGLRLAGARPVLAGVLFGLLTFKPQFGLMVPVALVAAGHWRCIASTVGTASLLAAAATAWQGPGAWAAWLGSLPGYQAWFELRALGVMPTVQAAMEMLGIPGAAARTVQAGAALLAALCTWSAWRRRDGVRVPVALAATALATPHAFVYDLPLLSAGVILFAHHRLRGTGLDHAATVGCAALLTFPMLLTSPHASIAVAAPMLLLALGLFVRHAPPTGPMPGRAPGRTFPSAADGVLPG